MSISFECLACGADYELAIPTLVEHPDKLKCTNCDVHPPAHRSHALATALEDLLAAIDGVRRAVSFEIELESQNLPEPYGKQGEVGLDFEDEDQEAEVRNRNSTDEDQESDGDNIEEAGFHEEEEEEDDDFEEDDIDDLDDDDLDDFDLDDDDDLEDDFEDEDDED